jgi:hypothetical protein
MLLRSGSNYRRNASYSPTLDHKNNDAEAGAEGDEGDEGEEGDEGDEGDEGEEGDEASAWQPWLIQGDDELTKMRAAAATAFWLAETAVVPGLNGGPPRGKWVRNRGRPNYEMLAQQQMMYPMATYLQMFRNQHRDLEGIDDCTEDDLRHFRPLQVESFNPDYSGQLIARGQTPTHDPNVQLLRLGAAARHTPMFAGRGPLTPWGNRMRDQLRF